MLIFTGRSFPLDPWVVMVTFLAFGVVLGQPPAEMSSDMKDSELGMGGGGVGQEDACVPPEEEEAEKT